MEVALVLILIFILMSNSGRCKSSKVGIKKCPKTTPPPPPPSIRRFLK